MSDHRDRDYYYLGGRAVSGVTTPVITVQVNHVVWLRYPLVNL